MTDQTDGADFEWDDQDDRGREQGPDAPDESSRTPTDDDTSSHERRHWLTNDAAYFVLLATMAGYLGGVGAGYLDATAVPEAAEWALFTSFLAANAWAFGSSLLESWGDR